MVKRIVLFLMAVMLCSPFAFAELVQGSGRQTVTTAGTAVALSSTASSFTALTICAETDNTGVIVVGNSDVVAVLASRKGIPLNAADCYTLDLNVGKLGNLNTVYIDSTVNTDGVTYHYQQQV